MQRTKNYGAAKSSKNLEDALRAGLWVPGRREGPGPDAGHGDC